MKTRSLFDIGTDFYILDDLCNTLEINEETGEIFDNTETLETLFNEIQLELGDKLDNTIKVIKDLESKADMLKKEKQRLQNRQKAFENRTIMLKGLMLRALQATGKDKLKTLEHSFSIRTTEKLIVADENKVPTDYIEFTKKVLNSDLKRDIKSGKVEASDGFYIERNKSLGVR